MSDEAKQLLDRELFYAPHKCREGSPADELLHKEMPNARGIWCVAIQARPMQAVNYVEVDFCPWCGGQLRKLDQRERLEQ